MSLKIIKSTDAIKVNQLTTVLYAQPGIGKTSLACTANNPLLLDFDRGAHRAANRKDSVQINSWDDVKSITADDLKPYATVVIDTAGRALDFLTADIIRRDPKKAYGGALTMPGFGALKAQFSAWLKHLHSLGKDVVLVAHMEEKQRGDDIIERLDITGGSKSEIYKAADAIGRISIINGQRTLLFSPTDAAYGKNPGQMDALPIPHLNHPDFPEFMTTVIDEIKLKLNAWSSEQIKASAELTRWSLLLKDVSTLNEVNELLDEAKVAPKAVKRLLHQHATKLGFIPNKNTGFYIEKEAA